MFIEEITKDTNALMDLNLSQLKYEFDYMQEVSSENDIFPRLDDDDLDLSLLMKDSTSLQDGTLNRGEHEK